MQRAFVRVAMLVSIFQPCIGLSVHAQNSSEAVAEIRNMGGSVTGLDYRPYQLAFTQNDLRGPTPIIELSSKRFDDRSLRFLSSLKLTFNNPPKNIEIDDPDAVLNRNKTRLTLRNTSVTDKGIAYLTSGASSQFNFTTISLVNESVTDEGIRSLAMLGSLKTLRLNKCKNLTDQCFVALSTSGLNTLALNNLPRLSSNMLRPLANVSSLNELDLTGCRNLDDNALEAVGKIKSLASLNLTGCQNLSDAAFASLENLPNLKRVNLNNCPQLQGPALLHLAEIRSLSEISIGRCRFPISAIKGFSKRSGIRIGTHKSKPIPLVDGMMNEWPTIFTLARDAEPVADRPVGQIIDVQTVYSQNLNTTCFLKFDFSEPVDLNFVKEQNRNFDLHFDFGDKGQITLDVVNNTAKLNLDGESKLIPIDQLEFDWQANANGKEHEMKVNFATIGVELSDSFVIDTSGEDRLYQPVRVELIDRRENLGLPIHHENPEGKLRK